MHLTASHCLHFSLKKFVKFGNQAIQQSPGQTKSFLHNALPFNRRRMQHAVTCPQAHQILSCCNIPSLVCVTRLMDRSCNSVAESSALGYTRAWILLVASIGAPTCTFDAASIFLLASTTGQYLFFTNLFLKNLNTSICILSSDLWILRVPGESFGLLLATLVASSLTEQV